MSPRPIFAFVALAAALVLFSTPSMVSAHVKETSNVVGNKRPADVTEEGVVSAAEAAVRHIQETSNSIFTYQLLRVVSATKQVVSGVKYVLTLDAAPTACTKQEMAAHEPPSSQKSGCRVDTRSASRYTVTVLSQPWRSPAFQVEIQSVGAVEAD